MIAASWKPSHVVIANVNDDPLIVDTAAPDSPVYAAFEGIWSLWNLN
ncbi:hypothetical protein P5G61_00705 [Paenibacillus sp. F6_3S_P_1C]|uniref:Uncharacterized protein n=1 Tax=Paenibacillus vandeheii TaxID=3035917 RepID=A0ABT8J521_9BACL|nr:hypothetical protein [Paenibacillus vandeheii]MDN4599731.1 hypothetical protein [Paenibacillus vandeheii]